MTAFRTQNKHRRRTNRQMLIAALFTSYVDRLEPWFGRPRDRLETSHLQSMAQAFATELLALSTGASECREHPNQVAEACGFCRGLWAPSAPGEDPEAAEDAK